MVIHTEQLPVITLFKLNTMLVDHRNEIPIGILSQCRFNEVGFWLKKVFCCDIIVSKVTAAATSTIGFFFPVFLAWSATSSSSRAACFCCTHQASCTCANYDYIKFFMLSSCFLPFCITKHAALPTNATNKKDVHNSILTSTRYSNGNFQLCNWCSFVQILASSHKPIWMTDSTNWVLVNHSTHLKFKRWIEDSNITPNRAEEYK